MIDIEKLLNNTLEELIHFVRFEAGSSSPNYFNAVTQDGIGLSLQQIPEEYSQLLLWFKNNEFKTYLELGVGKGGSFLLNSVFNTKAEKLLAVDSCDYWKDEQKNLINQKIDFLKSIGKNVEFINSTTDDFFLNYNSDEKFDCIFIDADHTYEGVSKDYYNTLKLIKSGGYIILHDVNNSVSSYEECAVRQFWDEIKNENSLEFIYSNTCGIGIKKIL